MATLRPSVKENDGYIEKIIKYIPAEIVAAYTVLVGYLSIGSNGDIPPNYKIYYIILITALVIITPIWTFYAVIDNPEPTKPSEKKKSAIFHAIVADLALVIWIYAIGNPILKSIICDCTNSMCKDCLLYSPELGSISLVLFTLLTPLLERIFLGTKPG